KLGRKELAIALRDPLAAVPDALAAYRLELSSDGHTLTYAYDTQAERTGITALLQALAEAGLRLKDLHTRQSSLEDIFVNLVSDR
ncbi:MAG: multidrug ABC transporter ATP-binding protein, partial [Phreatobacter sp.]|nr:multidrug ABC transporter ATP-binding protein [Phreatobacter sp.]